jgi:hypothetical protein
MSGRVDMNNLAVAILVSMQAGTVRSKTRRKRSAPQRMRVSEERSGSARAGRSQ